MQRRLHVHSFRLFTWVVNYICFVRQCCVSLELTRNISWKFCDWFCKSLISSEIWVYLTQCISLWLVSSTRGQLPVNKSQLHGRRSTWQSKKIVSVCSVLQWRCAGFVLLLFWICFISMLFVTKMLLTHSVRLPDKILEAWESMVWGKPKLCIFFARNNWGLYDRFLTLGCLSCFYFLQENSFFVFINDFILFWLFLTAWEMHSP